MHRGVAHMVGYPLPREGSGGPAPFAGSNIWGWPLKLKHGRSVSKRAVRILLECFLVYICFQTSQFQLSVSLVLGKQVWATIDSHCGTYDDVWKHNSGLK